MLFVGNEQENSERIVRLETKFEGLEAVLNRIEHKLDAREEKYITRDALNEILKSRDDKDIALQKQITEIKTEKKETRRMLPDIIMACSAIISLGLTLYLIFHK